MGAHAPMGPVKHPPAHNLGAKLCLQQGLQRPQGKDGPCSGKTLTTDTQALLERAAPPLPTQTTDLFVQLVCSGLRKLPNFLGAKTSDYPAVGLGTRARAPVYPSTCLRVTTPSYPYMSGSQTVQGTSPSFLYTRPQGYPCPPLYPAPPFCKYVKRKKCKHQSRLEPFPPTLTFNHVIMYRELVGV